MNINQKRLLVLLSINLFIFLHIFLWYKFGYQKVGTFSLNGIVSLLGTGLLNSAAIFFLVVIVVTLFFGRLFCGWGCHFAFFQELALKLLNKFGIHPTIIHSKANIIQYVFLLKTLTAIYEFWLIYGPPVFHLNIADTPVMTVDLPRNPVIIVLFIIFDAFLFIYLIGSRAFCRYVCPWAPLLAVFENFSPWRIRKINRCEGCMSCTNSCTMGIPVHEEIAKHKAVVSPSCIRCLACKSACPNGTLSYRWGPSILSITRGFKWLIPQQNTFHMYYEFLLVFFGVIVAFYTQKWLGSFQTFLGAAWGLCIGIIVIRILESKGVTSLGTFKNKRVLTLGLIILSTSVWYWGTSVSYETRMLLRGNRYMDTMEYDAAVMTYNQALKESPSDKEVRTALALAYKMKGEYLNAIREYRILIQRDPDNAILHNNLGTVYYRDGKFDLAIDEYMKSIQLDEKLTAAYGNIGLIFLKKGNVKEAVSFLRKVFQDDEEMYKYILAFYKTEKGQI